MIARFVNFVEQACTLAIVSSTSQLADTVKFADTIAELKGPGYTVTDNRCGRMDNEIDMMGARCALSFGNGPGQFWDIGSGNGLVGFEILKRGHKDVWIMDPSIGHLRAIQQRLQPDYLDRVTLARGYVPDGFRCEPNTVGGFWVGRLGHLMNFQHWVRALIQARECAIPGAYMVATATSLFIKGLELDFVPKFLARMDDFRANYRTANLARRDPSLVEKLNPGKLRIADYLPDRIAENQEFIYVQSVETFSAGFELAGWEVLEAGYYSDIPERSDNRLFGKERTFVIARAPGSGASGIVVKTRGKP